MKSGKGTFKWANGNSYEGDFKKNNMEGRGVFKWADGRIYIGEWR